MSLQAWSKLAGEGVVRCKPGGDIYGLVLKDRAEQISKLSQERHMTLATVESCTAGSLPHLLSQAEGASETLHGGFVVYTKANKVAAVGVPKELLARIPRSAPKSRRPWRKAGSRVAPLTLSLPLRASPAPSLTRTNPVGGYLSPRPPGTAASASAS